MSAQAAVLMALPQNGDPMPFGDLLKKVGGSAPQLRSDLLELQQIGSVQLIYGKGWRKLPSYLDGVEIPTEGVLSP